MQLLSGLNSNQWGSVLLKMRSEDHLLRSLFLATVQGGEPKSRAVLLLSWGWGIGI